jgi:hypothetical protein
VTERVLSTRDLNRALLARQLLLERSELPLEAALEQVAGLQAQYAPLAVRRPLVAAARLPPRPADRRLSRSAGRPGDPAAGHHPRRLGRRLPLVHRGRPGRPPAVVDPGGPPASSAAPTLEAAAALVRERPRRRPGPPERAGPAAHRHGLPEGGLDRGRALGRPGPGAAVGHLGAAPGRPVRPGRDWLGPWRVEPGEALEHLVRRYLAGFGPASLADLGSLGRPCP